MNTARLVWLKNIAESVTTRIVSDAIEMVRLKMMISLCSSHQPLRPMGAMPAEQTSPQVAGKRNLSEIKNEGRWLYWSGKALCE